MHPLAELGLEPGADERAVKRAYAVRLKSARPDVDPEGFQELRRVYEAALAYVRMTEEQRRWSAEDEAEIEAPTAPERLVAEEPQARREAAPETPPPVDVAAEPNAPPPAEREPEPFRPWEGLRPVDLREPEERFVFDVETFMRELYAHIQSGDDDLRAWLERKSANWPFAAKPVIAHHVLGALMRDEPTLTLADFDEIASFFGLDDVLTGADTIGLSRLRAQLGAADDLRDRQAKFRQLLRPDNRAELVRYMGWAGHGGYGSLSTRFIAWLLTSRYAYEFAFFLRPTPFLTQIVVGFVKNLDEGRIDALSPPIDGLALNFWFWADARREANRKWRYAAICVATVAAFYVFGTPDKLRQLGGGSGGSEVSLSRLPPRDREMTRVSQAAETLLKAGKNDEAIKAYDELIAAYQPPWSDRGAFIVAAAYFNSALAQARAGRSEDALRTNEALDAMFGKSQNLDVLRVVASGLINIAGAASTAGDFARARDVYGKVVDRYRSFSADEMRTLVALASAGRARALAGLGEEALATSACREFLSLYGGHKDERVAAAITTFRGLDCRLK